MWFIWVDGKPLSAYNCLVMEAKMTFVLIFIVIFSAFGQSTAINGRIINSETAKPIPFVNISCQTHSGEGTITNEDGRFTLNSRGSNCKFIISHLGFVNQEIRTSASKELKIVLIPTEVSLNEVELFGPKLSGREIVVKAIDRLKENHQVEPINYKIFNRVINYDLDSLIHSIIEFSATIHQSKGLTTTYAIEKIRVGAYTLASKEELRKNSFISSKKLELDNIFKFREDFLKQNASKKYDFEYHGLVSLKERLVFKIKFTTELNSYYKTGFLYIDRATYGIVQKNILSQTGRILHSVNFELINNSWYLSSATNWHQGYKTNTITERITFFKAVPDYSIQSEFEEIKSPRSIKDFTKDFNASYWEYDNQIPIPKWVEEQLKDKP